MHSYIDDFLIVDVDNAPVKEQGTDHIWSSSAQHCSNRIHTMLGMEFEPNMHKSEAPSNVTLAVEVNLQDVRSEDKVSFAPVTPITFFSAVSGTSVPSNSV